MPAGKVLNTVCLNKNAWIHSQKPKPDPDGLHLKRNRKDLCKLWNFEFFVKLSPVRTPYSNFLSTILMTFHQKTLKLESFTLKSSKKNWRSTQINASSSRQWHGRMRNMLYLQTRSCEMKKQRGTVLLTNYARKMRQGGGIIEFRCSHDTKRQKFLHNSRRKLANRIWFVRNRRISDEKNLWVMRRRLVSIGEVQESALLTTLAASKHLNDSEKLRLLQGTPLTAISFFKRFPSSMYWKRSSHLKQE